MRTGGRGLQAEEEGDSRTASAEGKILSSEEGAGGITGTKVPCLQRGSDPLTEPQSPASLAAGHARWGELTHARAASGAEMVQAWGQLQEVRELPHNLEPRQRAVQV